MENFELLQKHLALCGIEMSNNLLKNQSLNLKNLAVALLLCLYISLISVLLNETNTFEEGTDIFFRIISIGSFGIIYEIIVWKTSKLFEFINSLAGIVQASEYGNFQCFNLDHCVYV